MAGAFEDFATGRFTKGEVLDTVQASLNQKQRLQQLFFGDGVAFDGKQFVRTAVTVNAFDYLTAVPSAENEVASPTGSMYRRLRVRLRRAA